MNLLLVLAIGAITYASRAAAVVLMPEPPQYLRRLLERIPAPLFAGLASLSLMDSEGHFASTQILGAMIGAVLTLGFRSLPVALAGGLLGYLLADRLF